MLLKKIIHDLARLVSPDVLPSDTHKAVAVPFCNCGPCAFGRAGWCVYLCMAYADLKRASNALHKATHTFS